MALVPPEPQPTHLPVQALGSRGSKMFPVSCAYGGDAFPSCLALGMCWRAGGLLLQTARELQAHLSRRWLL